MKETIGRNLKILREANRFTQEQVAGFLGIGRSAYANYESGEREAPIDVIEKAATWFCCEPTMLLEENEKRVRSALVGAFRLDGLAEHDVAEVMRFKAVAMNYLKMKRIQAL